MSTYTVFCQESSGRGTIWVSSVEANTYEEAISTGRAECASDWGYETRNVHVLGVAEGSVHLVYWDDICD